MLGVVATFLITTGREREESQVPLSYVVANDVYQSDFERAQLDYLIARGGTSPFGIKIMHARFIDENGSVRNDSIYRSGDSMIISYDLKDIIPRQEAGKFMVSLERTLRLKTAQGLTVEGFNERYPFSVAFEVTEDSYYAIPQVLTLDSSELIAGDYSLLISVRDSYNVGYAQLEFTIA